MTYADGFGTGQVFWSMLWFFLFFIWIWLLIVVFADIFRSQDLGGWAKALWTIFVILVPYLGVFVYLIARGHKMGEHAAAAAQQQDAASRAYIQSVAWLGQPGRIRGDRANWPISATAVSSPSPEFQQAKAKALS